MVNILFGPALSPITTQHLQSISLNITIITSKKNIVGAISVPQKRLHRLHRLHRALLGSWWKLTTGDSVQALFAESTAVVVWKKNSANSEFYQGFTKGFQMDVVFLTRCHQISVFFHVFVHLVFSKVWNRSNLNWISFCTWRHTLNQSHTNLGLANCHCPPWPLRFKE